MRGAILRSAILNGAILVGSILTGADVTGAQATGVISPPPLVVSTVPVNCSFVAWISISTCNLMSGQSTLAVSIVGLTIDLAYKVNYPMSDLKVMWVLNGFTYHRSPASTFAITLTIVDIFGQQASGTFTAT